MNSPFTEMEIQSRIAEYSAQGETYLRRSGPVYAIKTGAWITWFVKCEFNFKNGEQRKERVEVHFTWQGIKHYFQKPILIPGISTWKPCDLRLGITPNRDPIND